MTSAEMTFAPATMDDLLKSLPAGASVLDLGCGNGSFAYTQFPQLAINALDEFKTPAKKFPTHVRYRQGSAEDLPYEKDSFDLVIANFVLEHVTDFTTAVDEIARVIKPGGHFYMSVPNARSFEDALYRSLYAGGGHLQRHSFESVLGTVYGRTDLKLLSYIEWPAGFSFLEDREGLRAFTQRMAEACHEALGIDLRARSNYLFVFQRQQGIGRPTYAVVCTYCGTGLQRRSDEQEWRCEACGRVNRAYSAADANDSTLDGDMLTLWNRYPHLRPSAEAALVAVAPPIAAAPPTPVRQPEQDLIRRLRLALRMLRRGRYER